jgi:hypothetical protein
MKKPILWAVAVVLVMAAGGLVWLQASPRSDAPQPTIGAPILRPNTAVRPLSAAQPTVGPAAATPTVIAVNTPTQVTVTVQITDPTLLPGGVNLLRLDSTGKTIAIIGLMYDDGTHGDAVAGDRVFSRTITLNEPTTGTAYFEASAAFKGVLKRTLSSPITLSIWNAFMDPTSGAEIAYPIVDIVTLSESARPGALSSTLLLNASDHRRNVQITVFDYGSFDSLQAWWTATLSTREYSGSLGTRDATFADTVQVVSCNGQPGLLVKGELFGYEATRFFCQAHTRVVELESVTPLEIVVQSDLSAIVATFTIF